MGNISNQILWPKGLAPYVLRATNLWTLPIRDFVMSVIEMLWILVYDRFPLASIQSLQSAKNAQKKVQTVHYGRWWGCINHHQPLGLPTLSDSPGFGQWLSAGRCWKHPGSTDTCVAPGMRQWSPNMTPETSSQEYWHWMALVMICNDQWVNQAVAKWN